MTDEENEYGSQFCSKTQVLGLMIGFTGSDTEDELPHSISYGIVLKSINKLSIKWKLSILFLIEIIKIERYNFLIVIYIFKLNK